MTQVSPNFAIDAQKKLGGGFASDAVRLLEEGLEVYPDYTTAYAVLARAYMQMNDLEAAFDTVKRGRKRFPANRALLMLDNDLRPFSLSTHPAKNDEAASSTDEVATGDAAPTAPAVSDGQSEVTREIESAVSPGDPEQDVASGNRLPVQPETLTESAQLQNNTGAERNVEEGSVATHRPDASAAQPDIPESKEELIDDALSNLGDDNENWMQVPALVAEEIETEGAELLADDADAEVDNGSMINQINVIDGSVVLDKTLLKRIRSRTGEPQLRLIETARVDKRVNRTLRSSNMRLIPGLEFTPLRVQSMRKQHVRLHYLPEPPTFPVIRGSEMNISTVLAVSLTKESTKKKKSESSKKSKDTDTQRSPLEELAARLERARIPIVTEEPEEVSTRQNVPGGFEPAVVSETMAMIYEQQGATEQAIKAYRQLARMKPDKLEYYEQRIAGLTKRTTD